MANAPTGYPPSNPTQLRRRASRSAAFFFEDPKFRRPIGQRQAQAADIRVPAPQRLLRIRNLLAASFDSSRDLGALLGDLAERPPVALKHRLLPHEALPAQNRNIDVFRLEF